MQTSLNVTSLDGSNKKSTKSITYINPNATNAELKTLAQKFNAISTNEYQDAERIDRQSVEEQGKATPSLVARDDWSDHVESAGYWQLGVNYTGESPIIYTNGKGASANIVTPTAAGGTVGSIRTYPYSGSTSWTIKAYSPETEHFLAGEFTFIKE